MVPPPDDSSSSQLEQINENVVVKAKFNQLIKIAASKPFLYPSLVLSAHVRTMNNLYLEGISAFKTQKLELAFIYLYRLLHFHLNLPKHPDFKSRSDSIKEMIQVFSGKTDEVLNILELLKPEIKSLYYNKFVLNTHASSTNVVETPYSDENKGETTAKSTSPNDNSTPIPPENKLPAPNDLFSTPADSRTTQDPPTIKRSFGSRRIHLSSEILIKFSHAANKQIGKHIETCGILAGTINKDDQLQVTHLLIPNQFGKSDSCGATEEGQFELYKYQIQHSLLTLGWIHTHPWVPKASSTGYPTPKESVSGPGGALFLSSVDLHTHCSYQQMLPEAIAIVMAPYQQQQCPISPSFCIFNLTQTGLATISSCKKSGFHNHKVASPLYQIAPHVDFNISPVKNVDSLKVVDLRS